MEETRRGVVIDVVDKAAIKKIEKDLTVAPIVDTSFGGFPKKHKYFVYNAKKTRIAVPRFYEGVVASVERAYGRADPAPDLVFRGALNPSLRQPEAVAATLDAMRTRGGAMLSLAPGHGKTVCALKIACDIGLKTLIVVHKEFLMNQWIERVAQFVPTARVGRLQQKKAEIEGRDIVVAMIHSIALREYPPETFEGFGLTIVDEAHHVSAPIFSQAMFIANSPHVLGLTATPERKDGLQRVLHWFLGNIAYQSEREGRDDVKVEVARFDASHVPIPYNQRTGKMCLASFVTALTEDPDRNVLVMARVAAHHAAGRKIILLSDRRAHCETLLEACRRRGIDAGLYLGGMSPEDLERSAARRVVLATFALATEGLDIPTLDTLVLATPKSDVVQATGRILRETTGKKRAPLIVDVVDSVGVAYAQFNKRKTFYLKAGFEIVSGASDGRSGASGGRSEETERPSAPMFIDEEST